MAPPIDRARDKPSILQLVLDLSPGGTQRLVIEITKRLADHFRPTVCCLDQAGAWADELRDRGIAVTQLQRSPGFHFSIGRQVAQLASDHGARVIHAHHYSPFIYGRIATVVNPRLKLVFTEHGRLSDAPPSRKRRLANLALSRFSGPVFAVSEALKGHMVDEGFSAGRVGVVHNGIELGTAPSATDRRAARHRLGVDEHTFLVGTAARLDTVKDLPTLVEAVALARKEHGHLSLAVIGDGDERHALETAIRDRNLLDAITLLGYRSDVRQLLPAFDLYVNSSISEGISLTILEAMAAAVPVIATAVGGTPEIVTDGETGLLVPARRPDLMAAAMIGLARDSDRRRILAAAGRSHVAACFSLERMVEDYTRTYERLERH
jgi:glycosyltransferase involved in cell wall biosynthesis